MSAKTENKSFETLFVEGVKEELKDQTKQLFHKVKNKLKEKRATKQIANPPITVEETPVRVNRKTASEKQIETPVVETPVVETPVETPVENQTEKAEETPIENQTEKTEETPIEDQTEKTEETPVEDQTEKAKKAPALKPIDAPIITKTEAPDLSDESDESDGSSNKKSKFETILNSTKKRTINVTKTVGIGTAYLVASIAGPIGVGAVMVLHEKSRRNTRNKTNNFHKCKELNKAIVKNKDYFFGTAKRTVLTAGILGTSLLQDASAPGYFGAAVSLTTMFAAGRGLNNMRLKGKTNNFEKMQKKNQKEQIRINPEISISPSLY